MLFHLSQLQYLYQKELSIQLLTTFGTSPLVMAPVFNILCLALASLALVYLLHLVTTDMYLDDRRYIRPIRTVVPNIVLPNHRYFPPAPNSYVIHRHPPSSHPHISPLSDIHGHPSSSTHVSSSVRTHGHH